MKTKIMKDNEVPEEPKNVEALTVREAQVLKMIAECYENDVIAAKLFVCKGTVKKHIENINDKLKPRNRYHLVLIGAEIFGIKAKDIES